MPLSQRVSLIAYLLAFCFIGSNSYADSDHRFFDSIVKNHVSNGVVDYPAIAEESSFNRYLDELAEPLAATSRDEQLAFWINGYNALAIRGILDGRSPSTFFGRVGYFKNAKYTIGGRTINLYDLERKVIIPFKEPRIHFAINCASASCPKLVSHVYTADQLDRQLETATRNFINDPTRNRFDRKNKVAHLSKIFDWFKKDFKQHSGSVQKYVAQFVNDPALAKELSNGEFRIKFLKYDWSLNGKPLRK